METQLQSWTCDTTCHERCIQSIKLNVVMLDSFKRCVMTLRNTTCSVREQLIKDHIDVCLKACLRLSPSKLQFVVAGVQVCKAVYAWANGFAAGSLNRHLAAFNREYQATLPPKVFVSL